MKLFFLILFYSSLSAHPFQAENITMAAAYFDIFNGISALLGNSTYLLMLKLIFLVGGFFVFVLGIFKMYNNKSDGKETSVSFLKYSIAAIFFLLLVSSGRSNLIVTAPVETTPYCSAIQASNGIVNNAASFDSYAVSMPGILPLSFSVFNSVGTALTEFSKNVFSAPDMNVTSDFSSFLNTPIKFGMLSFSNLSLDDTLITTHFGQFKNESTPGEFKRFLSECVFMVSSINAPAGKELLNTMDKTYSIFNTLDAFLVDSNYFIDYLSYSSKMDIIRPVGYDYGNSMLYPGIHTNGTTEYVTCKYAWQEHIKLLLQSVMSRENICAASLVKGITEDGIKVMVGKEVNLPPSMVNRMVVDYAAAATYNEISSQKIATDFEYASSKTIAEQDINQISSGLYLSQMIPYLQMGIRAILYAFFPFVFLVMMFPGGSTVMGNYLRSLLWVELWGPLLAILNIFLAYGASSLISGNYNDGIKTNLISDATMLSGVAGYMMAMVPALSWFLISGTGKMMAGLGYEFAAGMAKNLDSDLITKGFADKKRLEGYNSQSQVGEFLSRAEQSQIDYAKAGAEGTKYGVVANRLGGDLSKALNQEAWGKAARIAKTSALGDVYKDNSNADTVFKVDAENDFKAKVAQFETSGIIKNGKIDNGRLSELANSQGVSAAAMSLATNEKINQIKETTGLTKDSDVAAYIGKVDAATQVQDLNKRDDTFESFDYNKLNEVSNLLGESDAKEIKKTAQDFSTIKNQLGLKDDRSAGEAMAMMDSAVTTGGYSKTMAQVKTAMGDGTTDKEAIDNSSTVLSEQGEITGAKKTIDSKITSEVMSGLYGIDGDKINESKMKDSIDGQVADKVVKGEHLNYMNENFSEKERVNYLNNKATMEMGEQEGKLSGMVTAFESAGKEKDNRGEANNYANIAKKLKDGDYSTIGKASGIIRETAAFTELYSAMGKTADMEARLDAKLNQEEVSDFQVQEQIAKFVGTDFYGRQMKKLDEMDDGAKLQEILTRKATLESDNDSFGTLVKSDSINKVSEIKTVVDIAGGAAGQNVSGVNEFEFGSAVVREIKEIGNIGKVGSENNKGVGTIKEQLENYDTYATSKQALDLFKLGVIGATFALDIQKARFEAKTRMQFNESIKKTNGIVDNLWDDFKAKHPGEFEEFKKDRGLRSIKERISNLKKELGDTKSKIKVSEKRELQDFLQLQKDYRAQIIELEKEKISILTGVDKSTLTDDNSIFKQAMKSADKGFERGMNPKNIVKGGVLAVGGSVAAAIAEDTSDVFAQVSDHDSKTQVAAVAIGSSIRATAEALDLETWAKGAGVTFLSLRQQATSLMDNITDNSTDMSTVQKHASQLRKDIDEAATRGTAEVMYIAETYKNANVGESGIKHFVNTKTNERIEYTTNYDSITINDGRKLQDLNGKDGWNIPNDLLTYTDTNDARSGNLRKIIENGSDLF